MKKLSAILLAFLYLTITSGFAVNVHYCMGEVSGINLVTFGEAFCNACGKKAAANSCCKTDVKFFKVKTSHTVADGTLKFNPLQLAAFSPAGLWIKTPLFRSLYTVIRAHAPPLPPDKPLYLLNKVFLV